MYFKRVPSLVEKFRVETRMHPNIEANYLDDASARKYIYYILGLNNTILEQLNMHTRQDFAVNLYN